MFDDLTYLKLFVSKEESWEAILKDLYSRKTTKKEVQNRIGFAVYNGMLGKVDPVKGGMWVRSSESFTNYAGEDWTSKYQEIKKLDEEIILLREKLIKIEYMEPDEIAMSSRSIWIANYLQETWGLSEQEAYEELYVYGILAIENFAKGALYQNRKLIGRYHLVRSLHKYAYQNSMDLAKIKTRESNWYVSK